MSEILGIVLSLIALMLIVYLAYDRADLWGHVAKTKKNERKMEEEIDVLHK